MAVGLGELKLAPTVFWAMTPREFAAVLAWRNGQIPATAPGLTRSDLDRLRSLFPDAPPSAPQEP